MTTALHPSRFVACIGGLMLHDYDGASSTDGTLRQNATMRKNASQHNTKGHIHKSLTMYTFWATPSDPANNDFSNERSKNDSPETYCTQHSKEG